MVVPVQVYRDWELDAVKNERSSSSIQVMPPDRSGTLKPRSDVRPSSMRISSRGRDLCLLGSRGRSADVDTASRACGDASRRRSLHRGARKGEVRGFLWQNRDAGEIRMEKSVWRSHVEKPKRPKSKAAIPVIAQLKALLDRHKTTWQSEQGFSFFANARGDAMNLDALAKDVIRPALKGSAVEWHGRHAFRQGLATNLSSSRCIGQSHAADPASC